MPEANDIPATVRRLIERQHYAVLATSRDERPHAALVAFALSEDLATLLFVTPRATRKFSHIAQGGAVALLADDRGGGARDAFCAQAVTFYGSAREVAGDERERLLPLYLERHPHLREFALSPSCALVRVAVSRISLVRHFQEVTTFAVPV